MDEKGEEMDEDSDGADCGAAAGVCILRGEMFHFCEASMIVM